MNRRIPFILSPVDGKCELKTCAEHDGKTALLLSVMCSSRTASDRSEELAKIKGPMRWSLMQPIGGPVSNRVKRMQIDALCATGTVMLADMDGFVI